MATAISSAQHFVECQHCEKNPAQFLCKTCPGHLCETCKTEHEMRKISKNHEVIHLHKNREDTLGLLYCEKHTTNKLEWYCSHCKEPVCTKCHIESHNGHKMEELARVYNNIRSKLKEEKEQIEGALLPTYRELLSEEKTKKSEISRKTDEVRKQIEDHSQSIMDQVAKMKEDAIQNLEDEKKKVIKSVEKTEHKIKRRIETLTEINESISNSLGAIPGITFFKNTDSKLLQKMQGFPSTASYKLENFQPGDISIIRRQFGKSPKFTVLEEPNFQAGEFSKKDEFTISQETSIQAGGFSDENMNEEETLFEKYLKLKNDETVANLFDDFSLYDKQELLNLLKTGEKK